MSPSLVENLSETEKSIIRTLSGKTAFTHVSQISRESGVAGCDDAFFEKLEDKGLIELSSQRNGYYMITELGEKVASELHLG